MRRKAWSLMLMAGIALAAAGGAALVLLRSESGELAWRDRSRASPQAGSSRPAAGGSAASGPHVLLISLDTARQDHLSCYGYTRETTPHVDRLAADGLVFRHAVAASNWTLPSHASMLTGLYPTSHGAHWAREPSRPEEPAGRTGRMAQACRTLAEVLRDAGYRTGAVVANPWYLQKVFQLHQGFEHYDDRGGQAPALYRRAGEIADEAIGWLESGDERPLFLFLNFVDPHAPYFPPPPYDRWLPGASQRPAPDGSAGKASSGTRSAAFPKPSWSMKLWLEVHDRTLDEWVPLAPDVRAYFEGLYDGEIAYMDSQVGRVVQWLRDRGMYDETLIVVTADHGEAFGEHAVLGHGLTLYEPELAVPMIVKLPGRPGPSLRSDPATRRRGVVDDYAVHHVDIMPTALGELGIAVPEEVQGTSMLERSRRLLVAEAYPNQEKGPRWPRFLRMRRAVYGENLKLIVGEEGRRELFDLERDPLETEDLAERLEAESQRLAARLQEWVERVVPLEPEPGGPAEFDREHLRRLRELGYVN